MKRAALFIQMNDILWKTNAVIPIVNRPVVSAHSNKLRAPHERVGQWTVVVAEGLVPKAKA